MWKWVFIAIVFLAGLYTSLNYGTKRFTEPFQPRCPDILVQNGSEIWLKNSKLAEIPGVNPVKFKNLEEYTRFVEWQRARKIDCPVLFLQQSYDPQNQSVYQIRETPEIDPNAMKLVDATRGNPPYNKNSYPAMDPQNQAIGRPTTLDVYGDVGETQELSANPMDPNWGGAEYSMAAVNAGNYASDEVYKYSDSSHADRAGPIHGVGERDLRGMVEIDEKARDLPYLRSAGNYVDNKVESRSSEVPMLRMKQTVLVRDKIDRENEHKQKSST
jgi:hypothetical protein